jgi:Zn-finger nucleic acid-binding protein
MNTRTRDSIEIDVCDECKGVWLDGGELQKILSNERERNDAEMRDNWRMYDRGRDTYEPAAPAQEQKKSSIESLFS